MTGASASTITPSTAAAPPTARVIRVRRPRRLGARRLGHQWPGRRPMVVAPAR